MKATLGRGAASNHRDQQRQLGTGAPPVAGAPAAAVTDARGAGRIYSPSLTSAAAYAALGNVSRAQLCASIHNYFGGRNPGTPGWGANYAIGWNLDLTQYSPTNRWSRRRPAIRDDPSLVDGVPPQIAGRYMPLVLLEQFARASFRTFLYELADFPNSGALGLLTEDGTPKAAFSTTKGAAESGSQAAFTARLRYTVDNDGGDIRHVAFQKRDGTYFLAIWLALPG